MENINLRWLLAIIFLFALASYFITPYDDTDDKENGVRSGMTVYTDNLTGCQYLRVGLIGGVVPRTDGNGDQIGCK